MQTMRIVLGVFACLALSVGIFVSGFWLGMNTAKGELSLRVRIDGIRGQVFPDTFLVEHRGIPGPQVECLNWVSDHFNEPNAGLLSLICNGDSR